MSAHQPASLAPGLTGEASVTVDATLTAPALGTGDVDVLSSAALVALVEQAAVDALDGQLPPEMTTVGTRLDVQHIAATPVGMAVNAQAVLRVVDGRRLVFDVTAWDVLEKIGQGTHERFIVARQSFQDRAQKKGGGALSR